MSFNHARKDPAGDYWKMMMKDQPIPEVIRDLMILPGSRDSHLFVEDFDIRPNIIIYHTHVDHRDPRMQKSLNWDTMTSGQKSS